MGGLNRLRKSVDMYNNAQTIVMTRQEFEAEKNRIHIMYANEYNEKLHAMCDKRNDEISKGLDRAVDLILVHTAYELGCQLKMFEDEIENEEEKVQLVQTIMANIHKNIDKISRSKHPDKELKKIKNKIKTKLRIEF